MPHCALGKRLVTAAAIRWAVLWRASISASALLSVTMRTFASAVSGYVRSTRVSSTTAAKAACARRGEIASATARTGAPADTALLDPSGSVTVTWLMELKEVVGAGGLEPLTSSVSGRRSNQLSYAPAVLSAVNSGLNPNGQ